MAFEQAALKVEKVREFEQLKDLISRAFADDRAETTLKRLEQQGVRIRDFAAVLETRVLDRSDASAAAVYGELVVLDQAQVREFYLTKVEGASQELRHRFKKVYRYS
jgi:hypothetical protein